MLSALGACLVTEHLFVCSSGQLTDLMKCVFGALFLFCGSLDVFLSASAVLLVNCVFGALWLFLESLDDFTSGLATLWFGTCCVLGLHWYTRCWSHFGTQFGMHLWDTLSMDTLVQLQLLWYI